MQYVNEKISKEQYEKYKAMSPGKLNNTVEKTIPESWAYGYGWYGAKLACTDTEYFIVHTIGESCD